MIESKYLDLFWKDSVDKQWKIEYDGGAITNVDLFSQSIGISESLCSETELRFGCCEASSLKFKVANIIKPLMNDWLTVSVVLDNQENGAMVIGRYKVASDKPTSDRRHREIVAFDAMHDIINADVAEWYNSFLPKEDSTTTLKKFRESFVRHFDLTEVVPEGGLVNDKMVVAKTIMPEQISGLDVITAICEINGCFGHIGRDGKFHYIYLPQAIQGLYPADNLFPDHAHDNMPYQQQTGHLYPQDPKSVRIDSSHYISVDWEDFFTQQITKIQIRQEENDIGLIYGSGDNCYIIEDNFLVYGKTSDQLQTIAANIYSKITAIVYAPLKSADVVGNPCLEVGDPVRFLTKYEIVESYILQRTLKGIQALRDDYQANGVEKYSEEVNGVHKSIMQLKGKSNVLTRTIEETRLEMRDEDAKLYNTISITAGQIRTELANEVDGLNNTITVTAKEIRTELTDTKNELSNTITVTARDIRAELKNTKEGLETTIDITAAGIRTDVAKTYETKTDAGTQYANIRSSITQTASSIKAEVAETYETKSNASTEYTSLRGSISLEAGRISSEIERATKSETKISGELTTKTAELNSKIEQTESSINLSVSSKISETKTYAETQATAAKNAANSATDNKLKSYSTTVEMNSAINLSAEGITSTVSKTYETKTNASSQYTSLNSKITQNADAIETKVSNSEFGTKITQNASSVQIAWNNISKYIQFESGELRIYDSANVASQQLVAKFNYTGNHFYRDGYYVGSIGTNTWSNDSSHKGLGFQLEPNGKYMAFSQRTIPNQPSYVAMLTFSRAESIYEKYGIHLGCDFFAHSNSIYLTDKTRISEIASVSDKGNIGFFGGEVLIQAGATIQEKLYIPTGADVSCRSILKMYADIDMNNHSILNQSDIRLKENIESVSTDMLSVINLIELKQFDWRESGKHEDVGMIAQQVESICPELVNISEEGIYSLKVEKFIPYLIGAVQALSKQGGEPSTVFKAQKRDLYSNANNLYTKEEIEEAITLTRPPEPPEIVEVVPEPVMIPA